MVYWNQMALNPNGNHFRLRNVPLALLCGAKHKNRATFCLNYHQSPFSSERKIERERENGNLQK